MSYSDQKGGVGKSTSCGISAWLLSEQFKVLAIDMDSQGNLTRLLTQQNIYNFTNRTILQACRDLDATNYVHKISDSLDIIPSEDFTALFPRYLYREYSGNISLCLDRTLDPIRDQYDFILIDCPPALSEHTTNALCTSDFALVMFETHQFAYEAVDRIMETIESAKEKVNPKLRTIGILNHIIDSRRGDAMDFLSAVKSDYPGLVFDTNITRTAEASKLSYKGFVGNKQVNKAVKGHRPFVKELLERVHTF